MQITFLESLKISPEQTRYTNSAIPISLPIVIKKKYVIELDFKVSTQTIMMLP